MTLKQLYSYQEEKKETHKQKTLLNNSNEFNTNIEPCVKLLSDTDLLRLQDLMALKEQYKELRSKYEHLKCSNLNLFNELQNLKRHSIELLNEF